MLNSLPAWSRPLHQWVKLVTKAECPLCQRSTNQAFCLDCQRQVQQCQLTSPWQSTPDLQIFAWGSYTGALKRAIAALKYHNQPELAVPLGRWMAATWTAQPVRQSAIVVPIPMHAAKKKKRGFNQAELLAESFCSMTGLLLKANGLSRMRETEAQFRLSNTARQENLKEAFCLGSAFAAKLPAQPVWLLDDIYTTGATARSAVQTLRSHGIRVQGIIVLALAQSDR